MVLNSTPFLSDPPIATKIWEKNYYCQLYFLDMIFSNPNLVMKSIFQSKIYEIHYSDLKPVFNYKIWLLNQDSTQKSVYEINIPLHILGLISTPNLELILAPGGAAIHISSSNVGVEINSKIV